MKTARHRNDGLRKRCDCQRRAWPKCEHPWWVNFKWQGVHHRYSLDRLLGKHVKEKSDAKGHADRIRSEIRDGVFRAPGAPAPETPALDRLTLHELFAEYHKGYLVKKRGAAQLKAGDYQIALIEKTALPRTDGEVLAFGEWFVRDVSADTLEQFGEVRRARGRVAANRDLGVLRAAFNWAVGRGLVEKTPFLRGTTAVVKLTREDARTRRLEAGEDDRLLAACTDRLRAIVEAALETGCRRGELLSLQWSQVQWKPKAQLFLPAAKTKTRTDRYVPISARLRALLEMRLALQEAQRKDLPEKERPVPPESYVFGDELGAAMPSFKRAWERAVLVSHGVKPAYVMKDAGEARRPVKTATLTRECRAQLRAVDLHFHDLRREAASRWLEGGVQLHTIQTWLGHTKLTQTATYLRSTLQGQHDAMVAFDVRRGAVQPSATPSETGGDQAPSEAAIVNTDPSKDTAKHQMH